MKVCIMCGRTFFSGIVHCKHRMRELTKAQYIEVRRNRIMWGIEKFRARFARKERKGE